MLALFSARLVAAYRRTAQQVLTGNRMASGRVPDRANLLTLDLVSYEKGCVQLAVEPRDRHASLELFNQESLPDFTLGVLASEIALASDTHAPVNPATRKFLRSLPAGIRQRYELFRDDKLERRVELSSSEIPIVRAQKHIVPHVEHRVGKIVGVLVTPPGILFVDGRREDRLIATGEQVECAWSLRYEQTVVASVVVTQERTKLLALRSLGEFRTWADSRPGVVDMSALAERWSGVLRRLSAYDQS